MLEKLKYYFGQKQNNEVMNQTQFETSATSAESLVTQETEQIGTQLEIEFPANVEGSEEFNQSAQSSLEEPQSETKVNEPESAVISTPAPAETMDDILAKEESQYLFTDPRVVGWLSTAEQEILFGALLLFYQTSHTILDVGCGRGDLFGYMKYIFQTNDITYSGMDINNNLIEIGKRKFPDAIFINEDILKDEVDDKFDWVVGSGLFNLNDQPDMFSYAKDVVDKMYTKANIGVAFNLLCGEAEGLPEEDRKALIVHSPSVWLDYLLEKYNKVICRHDYLSGDVTFIIFKVNQ